MAIKQLESGQFLPLLLTRRKRKLFFSLQGRRHNSAQAKTRKISPSFSSCMSTCRHWHLQLREILVLCKTLSTQRMKPDQLIDWWYRDPHVHWKGSYLHGTRMKIIASCLLIVNRPSLITAPTAMSIKHWGSDKHARQPKKRVLPVQQSQMWHSKMVFFLFTLE